LAENFDQPNLIKTTMEESIENTKKIKKLKRKELYILLQNFSNLRTGQDQVMWSIIGAFWTTNSVLIVSIFSARENVFLIAGITVSLVGFSISLIWNIIQNRALNRIILYENSIKDIETKLKLEFQNCSFLTKNSKYYEGFENRKSARYVMKLFSKSVIYAWVLSFIIFTYLSLFEYYCK
jgi:hypothetical protein